MAQVYKDRIIKLLKHDDYKPLKLAHLAKALGVSTMKISSNSRKISTSFVRRDMLSSARKILSVFLRLPGKL